VIISAVVLAGSGFGGYGLVNYYQGTPAPEEGEVEAAETTEAGDGSILKVKSTMELESFLVNLADKDSARFVKASFMLGFDQVGLGTELSEDPVALAATRDKIISILSTKTAEQILTPEGKESLRTEIRDEVNSIFNMKSIIEVYIMDMVVQL
jgi:flagellar FliL protein